MTNTRRHQTSVTVQNETDVKTYAKEGSSVYIQQKRKVNKKLMGNKDMNLF